MQKSIWWYHLGFDMKNCWCQLPWCFEYFLLVFCFKICYLLEVHNWIEPHQENKILIPFRDSLKFQNFWRVPSLIPQESPFIGIKFPSHVSRSFNHEWTINKRIVVAPWSVCSPTDWVVLVGVLCGDTVLCSLARHLILTAPVFTQVYIK